MSSGTAPPPLPSNASATTEFERLIDRRLDRTRRRVKGVDLAAGLVVLAIGVLVYLLLAALIDQWVLAGGFSFWGRLLLWFGLLAGAGAYFFHRVAPPLLRRVNPVYAAETIEKSQPTLKNSLINFLLLRGRRDEVASPVYRAVEHQAAADLSNVRIETAVDRAHLVRLGAVLAAIVIFFCIYLVASPKNPLWSAARVLWPWASVEAPTRVTIRDIRPGDATAFHGESVTISAEISGLDDGESPVVVYSTADGQTVDQPVRMTQPDGGYRHQCQLPPGQQGLQQDYTYYLTAGDCRSRPFTITVQTAPAIDVDRITYRYPAYTGIAEQTIERQGDLRAIEGTEVLLHATANTEIESGTAEVDLGCTGRRGVRMTGDGHTATGRFTLRLHPDDASRGQYDCYQLRFTDTQGRENPRPIRYRIDVIRDLPPEVRLIEPQTPETPVAENGRLPIRVRAEDPDFGLRTVALRAECNGRELPLAPMFEQSGSAKAHQGEYVGTFNFEPARLGLKAGDRVRYWAEVEDNREPRPNRSATERRWIVVTGPERGEPSDQAKDDGRAAEQQDEQSPDNVRRPPDSLANQQEPDQTTTPDDGDQTQQNSQTEGQPSDQQGDQSAAEEQSGEQAGQSQDEGQQGEQPNERIDPDAAPGDAIQEILKDRQEQQEQQPSGQEQQGKEQPSPQAGDQQPSEEQQPGGQQGSPQDGQGESGGEQDNNQPGDSQAQGTSSDSEQPNDAEASDGLSQPGKESDSESHEPGKADGQAQERPGDDAHEDSRPGDATGGTKQPSSDDQPSSDQQPAEGQGRLPKPGEKTGDAVGRPSPEGDKPIQDQPGKAGQSPGEKQQPDDAQSPTTSDKPSTGQSDTAGDRSGEGQEGGGQQSDQPGVGGPGSHAPADQGGSKADEEGDGEPGGPGDNVKSDKATDQSDHKAAADDRAPSDAADKQTARRQDGQDAPAEDGEPTGVAHTPGQRGKEMPLGGGPGVGDKAGSHSPGVDPADPSNLDYARRQTTLALEHLRDQLAKEKPELLDRLGWTKDDARRFLERWDAMRRAAAQQGPQGEDARRQLDDALRSLGLRPRGVELRHGDASTDQPDQLRNAGRFAPPSEWAEQFRAYTRGIAGGDKKTDKE